MSSPNGYVNGKGSNHSAPAELRPEAPKAGSDDIAAFVTELEVPFDPAVIEWRVTNTAQNKKRGQVIPYADQRAYTDRLNQLFTPAGWTRRYTVHTSPNFERSKDRKSVAKVFVTCEVTIHRIGTHSATGEEWSDSDHAGTSAEAQAFKRACACFGLGRYLYYFSGIWVDLDDRKRPMERPELAGWATPQGWRNGLRPEQASADGWRKESSPGNRPQTGNAAANPALIQEIGKMQEVLGNSMYRGLMRLARAWKPDQIHDPGLQRKTLERMQAAERGLRRLEAALQEVSEGTLAGILKSLNIRFLDRISDLETLHKLVSELEAASGRAR
jgi:hypothetical protein